MAARIELETGGTVWKLHVKEGDAVKSGQELFILEVMKMEAPYEAPCDGVVSKLRITEGDVVAEGDIALELD